MQWHAIKMTHRAMSTCGTLTYAVPLSPSLSRSVVDEGDVKVDRWGWQPDNRLSSSVSVTGLFFHHYPVYHVPHLL